MLVDLRSDYQRRVFWTGEYETDIVHRLSEAIKPGGIVLDVGANVGFFAVPLAARVAQLGGRVVAVEPLPANADRLRRNIEANGLDERVVIVRAALGEAQGRMFLVRTDSLAPTGNAVRTTTEMPASNEVELRTLDELADELALGRCDAVKVDIEGGELAFLRGGERYLREHRPLLCVELNQVQMVAAGWRTGDLQSLADEWGYRLEVGDGPIENVFLVPV